VSVRKHGVSHEEMLHAPRHHWRAFETDDSSGTLFIGPDINGQRCEVGVVTDEAGTAAIHAMSAREKFLKGWWTR